MSWVSNPDSALFGGWLTSAYPGLGILGADIPTTGDNGGSPVLNDGISPSSEYRWALVTPPAAGTITLYEDLTFEFSGAADGIYSAVYRLWEDGADQGPATITLQVGPSHTTISVTLGNVVGAVSSAPVLRTAISATLANVFGSVASSARPVTSISATVADVFGAVASYPSGTTVTTISAVLDGVVGSVTSRSSPATAIDATLGNITGSLNSKVIPATTISATLDHVTGAISSYSSGVAVTSISATLEDVLGNLPTSSGGFSGSLSDADIARIAAAVIAALRAATPLVPVDAPTASEVATAVWSHPLP